MGVEALGEVRGEEEEYSSLHYDLDYVHLDDRSSVAGSQLTLSEVNRNLVV